MNRIEIARTTVAGRRPTSGSRSPGELYLNLVDRVLGFIDADGNPVDVTFGAIPAKPVGAAAALIVDPAGFPAWLEVDSGLIVQQPRAAINQTIRSQAVSDVPLTLRGASGQTADLFRVRSGADVRYLDVSAGGVTRITGPATTMLELSDNSGSVMRVGVLGGRVAFLDPIQAPSLRLASGGQARHLTVAANGWATLDGSLSIAGSMDVQGSATLGNSLVIDASPGGIAQVVLRNNAGNSTRGLAYAADDGSWVRLLKYKGEGASIQADVYLHLTLGDAQIHGLTTVVPPSGASVMTWTRTEGRYLRYVDYPATLDNRYLLHANLGASIAAMGVYDIGAIVFAGTEVAFGETGAGTPTAGSNWRLTYLRQNDGQWREFLTGALPGTWMLLNPVNMGGNDTVFALLKRIS